MAHTCGFLAFPVTKARFAILFFLFLSSCNVALAQEELTSVRDLQWTGTVRSTVEDRIEIVDADGRTRTAFVQVDAEKPLMLEGSRLPVVAPAQIEVTGTLAHDGLIPGMTVEVRGRFDKRGRLAEVESMTAVLPYENASGGRFLDVAEDEDGLRGAVVSGTVKSVGRQRLVLTVSTDDLWKEKSLTVPMDEAVPLAIRASTLALLRPGDILDTMAVTELSSGEYVVRGMKVTMVGERPTAALTANEQLQLRFAQLSDVRPGSIRDERTKHLLLRTDLSPRRTAILVHKLESMLELVGSYYNRSLRQPIQCVVVDDMTLWDPTEFPPRALDKIRAGEGMTAYARVGSQQNAIVYSASDDAIVQHEAVHAFCFLAFGDTGPLWYAEGMAEAGRFWRTDNSGIWADPAIVGYLRHTNRLDIPAILISDTIEGELWKAYAWRWALCHMLINNPNYSRDFSRLGLNLMNGKQASFDGTFGGSAEQIQFEFQHYMEHFDYGLRADLIAWDWETPARRPTAGKTNQVTIRADRGWQASGVEVTNGRVFGFQTEGTWQTEPSKAATDAGGDAGDGRGQLLGIVLTAEGLSEPFVIGREQEWTADESGVLYLRCDEPLNRIADNSGEIEVAIEAR